jgi:hypothetical protein
MFAMFMRFLDDPKPAALSDSAARAKELFGCAACPTPTIVTPTKSETAALPNPTVQAYSDVLVHHMGKRLSEDISRGLASGDMFRSTPLWGDRRTDDSRAGLTRYGPSEANAVIAGFRALPPNDLVRRQPSSQDFNKGVGAAVHLKRPSKIIYLALLALCTTAHAAEKPKTYRAPRLPDGHVNMQGIWKNSNLTPLERPHGFSQLAITAADAAMLKAEYLVPAGGPDQPDDPGRALENRSIERIRGELRSSQIIDPTDGKIPWIEAYKEKPEALRRAALTEFDNPEQRPAIERCLGSNSAPPMQPKPESNLYQFVQTPDTTVIMSEFINDARMVRMNAPHSPAAVTSWLGDSVGWWEHDTLVVETKYFAPHSAVRMNARYVFLVSPETTVMERFTRVSDQELNYIFTVIDPTFYLRPWTGETHFLLSNERIFECGCHEGNYSLRNELEAARALDAKTEHPGASNAN